MRKKNSMVAIQHTGNVSFVQAIRLAFTMWLSSDNKFMTSISEEVVSNRQALLIWYALISFCLLLCFAGSSYVLVPVLLAANFGISVYVCAKGGIK